MVKIQGSDMFYTPTSKEDLHRLLDGYSGTERVIAYQVAMFTINYCAHLTRNNEEVESND